MKHAGHDALNQIAPLLEDIRQWTPPLKEKQPGIFYLKSVAFLHFHEDPSGIFADLKVSGDWVRYSVSQAEEWSVLLQAIAKQLPQSP